MTVWSVHDFKEYAGAYTVVRSALDQFRPGTDVEFARYGGPDVFIVDIETGEHVGVPANALDLEESEGGAWRLLGNGRMLLEVGPVPPRLPAAGLPTAQDLPHRFEVHSPAPLATAQAGDPSGPHPARRGYWELSSIESLRRPRWTADNRPLPEIGSDEARRVR